MRIKYKQPYWLKFQWDISEHHDNQYVTEFDKEENEDLNGFLLETNYIINCEFRTKSNYKRDEISMIFGKPGKNIGLSYNSTSNVATLTNTYATGNLITLSSTTNLTVNAPIVFTGNVFGGLVANTVYYVSYLSTPNIAVSATRTSGTHGANFALSTATGNAVASYYTSGTEIWSRIPLQTW